MIKTFLAFLPIIPYNKHEPADILPENNDKYGGIFDGIHTG